MAAYVFFMELQTYVLHVDKWLNAIALAFVSSELVLSLFVMLLLWRAYGLPVDCWNCRI